MKCISRAFLVAIVLSLGLTNWRVDAADQPSSPATNSPATAASADPLLRVPTPGAVRPLPVAFTKPAPSGMADLRGIEKHVKNLISRISASVVALDVGVAEGSGVVITANGLVLTAGHVAGRANRNVTITFPDGKTARGKTLGAIESPDCGLIRITDPGPWPHTDIAGPRAPMPGDWVLALGHPGGFDPERSMVARFGRIVEVANRAVRTDCTITTGDSGGPLVDMHGRVLGIHSYISNGFDDNYHIPITQFVEHWSRLANGESGGTRGSRDSAALN
jgi:serine protease Do